MATPHLAPHERTVTVCADCGCQFDASDEPHEIDGCPEHGARLTDVTRWRPAAVLGLPVRTGSDIADVEVKQVLHSAAGCSDAAANLRVACWNALYSDDRDIVDRAREVIALAFNLMSGRMSVLGTQADLERLGLVGGAS